MTRNKRLTTIYANIELDGLVIDWHLAEVDSSVPDPITYDQPVYAYA